VFELETLNVIHLWNVKRDHENLYLISVCKYFGDEKWLLSTSYTWIKIAPCRPIRSRIGSCTHVAGLAAHNNNSW
jgi:hypothetical protein